MWPGVTSCAGFSLLEVTIVVAIGLTITAIGLPRITNVVAAMKLRASMTTVSGFLQNVRMIAVKKNRSMSCSQTQEWVKPASYGILAVTGRLQMNGNFTWHGPVLVAKIYPDAGHHTGADLLATLGSPTVNWNGGGGNSILYDHCWATNMMSKVPIDSPISLRPLKVLSFRSLPY